MKDLETLLHTYQTAANHKDVDAFMSIFDTDIRIFDAWKWEYNGLDSWQKMVEGWFGSLGKERVVVSFEDVQIRAGEDMAVISAYARFAGVSETNEELRYLHNRFTWVARKKDGVWKIIHEHTSNPADMSTMQVRLQR